MERGFAYTVSFRVVESVMAFLLLNLLEKTVGVATQSAVFSTLQSDQIGAGFHKGLILPTPWSCILIMNSTLPESKQFHETILFRRKSKIKVLRVQMSMETTYFWNYS
jgi:hypothetical protein